MLAALSLHAAGEEEAGANLSVLANRSMSLRGSSMEGSLGVTSSVASACTASWAYNCNSNPTCCDAGFICFEKTPNWAACLQTCTPGVVQPNDDGKPIPWTCEILGGAAFPNPITPAPSEGEGCSDVNDQCSYWAADGQCSINPEYMHQSCKSSCGLCQPGVTTTSTPQPSSTTQPSLTTQPSPTTQPSSQCGDQNDQCAAWAANGECAHNPGYMNIKCAKSCGKCS